MSSGFSINLISDTITLPSVAMKEAMMQASLGDDVFRTDPTVIELEEYSAALFGQEASLFCPSGTMANQIAIKIHTQPLDEIICEINSHVYQFEVGGYAFHSQVAIQALPGEEGKLTPNLIVSNIRPKFDWFPRTKLVCLENTGNRVGGNYYTLDELIEISTICKENNLLLHLDGARIFNAIVAAGYTSLQIGKLFDSISVCLSKGLGAPVGSLLLSNHHAIAEARRIRKVMGGGMRQTGMLAAAGLFALQNNISRLSIDHKHAKQIAECLQTLKVVRAIKPVDTNIIIFELIENMPSSTFVDHLSKHGVQALSFGKNSIRMVTHLDISTEMVHKTCETLRIIDEFLFAS